MGDVTPQTIWIINQYASTPNSGMGGRHYYLAKELAKQGHKVYLVAASYTHLLRNPPVIDDAYKVEPVAGFSFIWLKAPTYQGAHDKKRVLNWFYFSWKLLKLPKIISDKPDVILYSSPSLVPYIAAKYLAEKLKCKLVFEVRDIWPLTLIELGGYSPKHPFIRLMQWVEDKAYCDSDAVLSNLPNAVEHMVQRGMERKKFTWIPNGFDMDEVAQTEPLTKNSLAELPKGKFIVGYTGTIGVANALESFIDAASLAKSDDTLAWVLVGAGKEKPNLQIKCKNLGLSNVYFVNSIPKTQIQTMLSQFDVCFIGWKSEPIYRFGTAPNKVPEYLYAGKPIVHAFSGYGDPVNIANAGISVSAESSHAIVSAVLELKGMTPVQRDQLGKNGREFVMKNHDYSKLAVKLFKVMLSENEKTV
nr:glycosyltransferase WbuB [Rhodospirillales bacterium]